MVQSYKSQAKIHGSVMPIQPGGGSLNWDKGWIVPDVAGNFSDQNYGEGLQIPSMDLSFVLLNGNSALCPIHNTILQSFFTRSDDPAHDVSAIAAAGFFDGSTGYDLALVKPSSFTISGQKGAPVQFSASYAFYMPDGGTAPAARTTPFNAYGAFAGIPITFQHCSFYTGAGYNDPLNGVVSWSITFNNNLTPDLSQVSGGPGQQVFPINMNAGKPTASFQLSFNAREGISNHISTGDSFVVAIESGPVSLVLVAPKLLVAQPDSRNNQAPRVMRPYNGQCLGIGNDVDESCLFISS